MLFSIIIPCYNVEKYIKQCLDSILIQNYDDYEVILVDDGSTDETGEICNEYCEKYQQFKVIHQKNAGQACARNIGIDTAIGKYIICIDSDDYISSNNFLTKVAEKTVSEPDVIQYGYRKLFESTGNLGKPIDTYPEVAGRSRAEIIESLVKTNTYDGTAWTKAVRRDFLKENNICFVPGMKSADSEWNLEIVTRAKKYDFVHQDFIVYRQRSGSTSHTANIKSLVDNLSILEHWPGRFEERNLENKLKESLMMVLARYFANDMILFSSLTPKESNVYFERFHKSCYILEYSVSSRALKMKWLVRLLGLKMSLVLLRQIIKFR